MRDCLKNKAYTCNEYREEMILLGLKRQLENKALSSEERKKLLEAIREIEKKMDME